MNPCPKLSKCSFLDTESLAVVNAASSFNVSVATLNSSIYLVTFSSFILLYLCWGGGPSQLQPLSFIPDLFSYCLYYLYIVSMHILTPWSYYLQ